ncbi:protein AAR2 homolog [Nilaparvata lugens]|uniref:protein AAR2 homolog n=1 Tax=Nilaparvata lugens TaxID=108931 RepID=UPI00193E7E7D|nr:protein AAR2 homolog [Nilaparvata lugens]
METMEIDQEVAKRLLVEGCTFVCTGVPEGTQFGIDMKSWTVGEKFKGVKMIPPGLHFIYINATNEHNDYAPRIGFIHNFKPKEMLVKKWDSEKEDISDEVVSDEEVARFKYNLKELDKFLGVYPYDVYKRWTKLTNELKDEVVSRLTPKCGKLRSALELTASDPGDARPKQRRSLSRYTTQEEREEQLLPHLQATPGTAFRYSRFPDRSHPEGASPAEITRHSMDKTYTLDGMIRAHCNKPEDLIGELQFSFVCFVIGWSLESFEQWRQLVSLLCSCEAAVERRHTLYARFLEALEAQLDEVPEDFLVDIVASNNVVYRSLKDLFRTINSSDKIDGRLQSKAERFRGRLTQKFQWDFGGLDCEDDEDAPVVVTL